MTVDSFVGSCRLGVRQIDSLPSKLGLHAFRGHYIRKIFGIVLRHDTWNPSMFFSCFVFSVLESATHAVHPRVVDALLRASIVVCVSFVAARTAKQVSNPLSTTGNSFRLHNGNMGLFCDTRRPMPLSESSILAAATGRVRVAAKQFDMELWSLVVFIIQGWAMRNYPPMDIPRRRSLQIVCNETWKFHNLFHPASISSPSTFIPAISILLYHCCGQQTTSTIAPHW